MSMTTELELAQRMKAAALNATGAYERLSMMPEGDIFDISLAEGTQLDADITALNSFHDEATPANVLELVEALEKAQGMEDYWKTQCRGIVDHSEKLQAQIEQWKKLNVQFCSNADADISALRQRIAELEARTVKLPDYSETYTTGFASEIEHQVRKVLEMAGVAVEGE